MAARRFQPRRLASQVLVAVLGWVGLVFALSVVIYLLSDDTPELESFLSILAPFPNNDEVIYLIWIPAAVIVLMQYLLILPLARPVKKNGTPRRPWYAAVIAGLLWALLVGGLFSLLAELPRLPYALEIVAPSNGYDPEAQADQTVEDLTAWLWLVAFGFMVCTWIGWTWALFHAMRSQPNTWLSRTIRWLLVGSCIELAIALPLYLIVRRRFDCWCALPSLWAVCFSMAALLTLTGPGAILLWHRRRGGPPGIWVDHCLICGYQRHPESGPCCPECGVRWGRVSARQSVSSNGIDPQD